jgi:hypothetical protein
MWDKDPHDIIDPTNKRHIITKTMKIKNDRNAKEIWITWSECSRREMRYYATSRYHNNKTIKTVIANSTFVVDRSNSVDCFCPTAKLSNEVVLSQPAAM